jgi:hypothetical protein
LPVASLKFPDAPAVASKATSSEMMSPTSM